MRVECLHSEGTTLHSIVQQYWSIYTTIHLKYILTYT
jgi:hypothetical protein